MKDYISPIEMITNSIIKSADEQVDEFLLFSVEREIGFKVDKEELIRALAYDRKQYEKGFDDGLKAAREWNLVGEGYPSKEQEYDDFLVCDKEGNVDIQTLYYSMCDDEPFFSGMKDNVVAWMKLPEPVKRGDAE